MKVKDYFTIFLAVAIIGVGFFLVQKYINGKNPTGAAVVGGTIDGDYFKGEVNAPLIIYEYSDYECPFCAKFALEVMPQIELNYIKTGKIKWFFRDSPETLHPQSIPAAMAARCAGDQGKYWQMHDILFANQDSFNNINYKRWASDIGLSVGAFTECLDGKLHLDDIQSDVISGNDLGIRGTPAFVINGNIFYGACPYETFQKAFDAEINGENWKVVNCQFVAG